MEPRFEVTALRQAICKAKADADALSGTPDYGTYNFDTPAIELPEGYDTSEFTTRATPTTGFVNFKKIRLWQNLSDMTSAASTMR